jgi:hypothetical protein
VLRMALNNGSDNKYKKTEKSGTAGWRNIDRGWSGLILSPFHNEGDKKSAREDTNGWPSVVRGWLLMSNIARMTKLKCRTYKIMTLATLCGTEHLTGLPAGWTLTMTN